MKVSRNDDGTVLLPYADHLPWDGVGTRIPEDASIDEALAMSGLDWEVRTKDLFDADGQRVSGYKVTKRGDTPLGIVSRRYTPYQNRELFELAKEVAHYGVWDSAGALYGGKGVFVCLRLMKAHYEVRPGDEIVSYLVILSSHNGQRGITPYVATARPQCANIMWIGHGRDRWNHIIHRGRVPERIKVLKATMLAVTSEATYRNRQFKTLVQTPATPGRVLTIYESLWPTREGQAELKQYVREGNMASRVYAADGVFEGARLDAQRRNQQECVTALARQSVQGSATLWDLWQGYTDFIDHSYHPNDHRKQSARMMSMVAGRGAVARRKALGMFLQVAQEGLK